MKLKDLEAGKIYKCRLSGKKVLVCEIEKEVTKVKKVKGKDEFIKQLEKAKVGKYGVGLDNGDFAYKHDELFDGQLETFNT